MTQSLSNLVEKHILQEKVSFHTPGHKGHSWQTSGSLIADRQLKEDLTELPELDELANPDGALADLESRAAQVWGSRSTIISVNGASAGIVAAMLMLAKYGTHILVPRNCHRSVINGLILSGLEPIWFEPTWNEDWGLWGAVDIQELTKIIENFGKRSADQAAHIIGLLITSPTYAGALSDMHSLATLAKKHKIPLVVDEAHGQHLLWTTNNDKAALIAGADIVIHSLHKTLSCLTQTGLVHLSANAIDEYGFSTDELRACLNLIQSSSPSYLMLNSIDQLVTAFGDGRAQKEIKKMDSIGLQLKEFLKKKSDFDVYQSSCGTTSTHILIRHKKLPAPVLNQLLQGFGIFPETILGQGVLLLLGIGSQPDDVDYLLRVLDNDSARWNCRGAACAPGFSTTAIAPNNLQTTIGRTSL